MSKCFGTNGVFVKRVHSFCAIDIFVFMFVNLDDAVPSKMGSALKLSLTAAADDFLIVFLRK